MDQRGKCNSVEGQSDRDYTNIKKKERLRVLLVSSQFLRVETVEQDRRVLVA